MTPCQVRQRFIVQGRVQGVGFRPFVYTTATALNLTGFVQNTPAGVYIEIQGSPASINTFTNTLHNNPPPLARITDCQIEALPTLPPNKKSLAFYIAPSLHAPAHNTLISPDVATCENCLADIQDKNNKRFAYAFTNCTYCGPRYSITASMPYDRNATSMACFPMCPDCQQEYNNPANRRFHAQPNACPICGPKLWFVAGEELVGGRGKETFAKVSFPLPPTPPITHPSKAFICNKFIQETKIHEDAVSPIQKAVNLLINGDILALKGLGGFQLACNAFDVGTITKLRQRKNRPHKPFALMLPSLEEAKKIALVNPQEEALLLSPEHPIVLCPMRDQIQGKKTIELHAQAHILRSLISPDSPFIGIMLPYTPLHHILLNTYRLALEQKDSAKYPLALVMTSGNRNGEPICLGNREALSTLSDIADGFLCHNRDILVRVDDSVIMPQIHTDEDIKEANVKPPIFLRRARGYVPLPITLFSEAKGQHEDVTLFPSVLGMGADLKNTVCFTKGSDAFVSQHIGDLENVATESFQLEAITHLKSLLGVTPKCIVHDLHPDFNSTCKAKDLGKLWSIPTYPLQHHYAHAHALLAEHQYLNGEPALVWTLDGTGLGEDGTLWGGELLLINASNAYHKLIDKHIKIKDTQQNSDLIIHKRLAHLPHILLPGGDKAVHEPWRIAHQLLEDLNLLQKTTRPLPWLPSYAKAVAILPQMVKQGINTPKSSSCGRLFDAVAALLGLCNSTSYEGQAAIRLEAVQYEDRSIQHINSSSIENNFYPCPLILEDDFLIPDTHAIFMAVWQEWQNNVPIPLISRRFHAGLAEGLAACAAAHAKDHNIKYVGLSGGCLQNRTLASLLGEAIRRYGCIPLEHRLLPPNDGCISLGQAAWGKLRGGER